MRKKYFLKNGGKILASKHFLGGKCSTTSSTVGRGISGGKLSVYQDTDLHLTLQV